MPTSSQTRAVAAFTCLGDACEDTCCVGWNMQVMPQTVERYKTQAPELLHALEPMGENFVMKRDPATDYCIKFDNGWCSIHRDYGADFLGDACHFFPRVTRALGEQVIVNATISCPEAARLMLFGDNPFDRSKHEEIRTPYALKQYLPAGLSEADALTLHDRFVTEAANSAHSAEMNLLRLVSTAYALDMQPVAQWLGASDFYFRTAESRIAPAETVPADLFNLTVALNGLIVASKAQKRTRLTHIRDAIANTLGIHFDETNPGAITTTPDAPQRVIKLVQCWKSLDQAPLQQLLTRYLQAQLSTALIPFAGLGNTLAERMVIMGVRFATIKLALMTEVNMQQRAPDAAAAVRIIQTLSRFLDHLADPALSLQIYNETGWVREARLRALLMV